ncbi:LamG domain-containing protein, partial [Akkermansiaceae bacterium]|nr:LamG domain-containing protein [Akkermansiaceae bacterium]
MTHLLNSVTKSRLAKKLKSVCMALLGMVSATTAQTYEESGGLVVMEVENTSSPLGLWQEQNSLSGHSGSGYLQFSGNTYETGPATSPLEYSFKINQAGLYHLHLRCAKETHDGRTDVANDCYVRVEGDYSAGSGPHDGHGDNASLSLLQNDTKYFGGATNSWKWENGEDSSGGNGNLDPGGHENKRVAVYDFKAGETYKLVVSGRSKFFRIDRIVFRHTSSPENDAENLSTPESGFVSGVGNYVYDATEDFPDITSGAVPYYKDNGNDALAIAANVVANRTGFARASRTFDGVSGSYDVTITTMTEEDGESTYRLLVNGTQVATYTNAFVFDPPDSPLDLQPDTHTWKGIQVANGETIAIESNADSNEQVSESGDGNPPWAWARGRWQQIALSPSRNLVKPPAGRLAIVSDGNSPDPDDIGAKAVMFGILNGAGLQDRLVHVSHSCDLNPFLNPGNQSIDAPNELRRQNKLHQLTGEGIGFFGPFPNLTSYFNCRVDQNGAVNDLRDAIDASSANDPLWIVEGGEPDIIGYALEEATASKRQFVHVISHHPANDNSGDFFTWQEILDFGVTEHQIGDQNVGLQVLISSGAWDWAENHSRAEIVWILNQLKYAEEDGVVGFQNNKYDCSDAGMVYWWITGANKGGNRNSTPLEMREMLLNVPGPGSGDVLRPVGHWKLDEGSGGVALDSSDYGQNGSLLNGVTWGSDATRATYAQFDGVDDRISTTFRYALSSGDDFTWAWWAKKASGSSTGAIMVGNRYPEGSPNERYEFIKLMAHEAQFADAEVAGSIEKYNYADLPADEWHHYAMVKSGTSYQWYIDGIPEGNPLLFNYDESSSIPFLIGGDDDGSGTKVNEHFEGGIDDVVLYQRALTASELVDVQNGIYFPAPPVIELLAGWDAWDSGTAPSSTVTAVGVTASATASATGGNWVGNENGDSGRGASDDTSWGTFAGSPAANSALSPNANFSLPNGMTNGELTFTITNSGSGDIHLDKFHFDAVAFRPNAARTYALNVLAGSDITVGNVVTSAAGAITHLGGNLGPG